MKPIVPLALGLVLLTLASTSAQAAAIDVSPLVNEAITEIALPALVALVPVLGALVVLPLRRFLDQKTGDVLASRVNDLLDRAIAFAAKQAEGWVDEKDFHANVDGWIANVAADYAVSHAPALMQQAGAVVSAKASDLAKEAADKLIREKIMARLPSHPVVAAVKGLAVPVELTPVLAAATV